MYFKMCYAMQNAMISLSPFGSSNSAMERFDEQLPFLKPKDRIT
jgi:hypothetical protein